MKRPSTSSHGFTLIELLVVIAILAIISVMALVGLNRIIDNQAAAREQAERWQRIQLAMRLITQDLAQLIKRGRRYLRSTADRKQHEDRRTCGEKPDDSVDHVESF